MNDIDSLKYQKLLWAFVVIVAVVLFFMWRFYPSKSDLGYGFDLWVLFMICSVAIILISPIVILLRLTRIIKGRESFGYILIGSLNICLGGYGLFELIVSHIQHGFYGLLLMRVANLSFASFIFIDTFVKEIPSLIKTT